MRTLTSRSQTPSVPPPPWFVVQGSDFRAQGSRFGGFRVQGSGFRDHGLGVQGSELGGCWVQGSGFRLPGAEFRVQG